MSVSLIWTNHSSILVVVRPTTLNKWAILSITCVYRCICLAASPLVKAQLLSYNFSWFFSLPYHQQVCQGWCTYLKQPVVKNVVIVHLVSVLFVHDHIPLFTRFCEGRSQSMVLLLCARLVMEWTFLLKYYSEQEHLTWPGASGQFAYHLVHVLDFAICLSRGSQVVSERGAGKFDYSLYLQGLRVSDGNDYESPGAWL